MEILCCETVNNLSQPFLDHRPFLKEIKAMGEMRIVLDCKLDIIHEVFKQAQQVAGFTLGYSKCSAALSALKQSIMMGQEAKS